MALPKRFNEATGIVLVTHLSEGVGITSSLDVGVAGACLGIGAHLEIEARSPASLPASYTRLFTNLL